MALFGSRNQRRYNSRGQSRGGLTKVIVALFVIALLGGGVYAWASLTDDGPGEGQSVTTTDGSTLEKLASIITDGGQGSSEGGGETDQAQNPVQHQKTSGQVEQLILQADELHKQKHLLQARDIYNQALHGQISEYDAAKVRAQMTSINEVLVFSPMVLPNDPLTARYTIRPGDLLSKIAPRYAISWQLLGTINNIKNPQNLRVGRTIKVLNGPFHMVVNKRDFRMDVYAGLPKGGLMYIRSYKVGLGEHDSTPVGSYAIRNKLENPAWTNPRTGKHYPASDPDIPIGEYWIGLIGTDKNTASLEGYGIHGTNEPESIGKMASMGCVRMLDDDVAMIYQLIHEKKTQVSIRD